MQVSRGYFRSSLPGTNGRRQDQKAAERPGVRSNGDEAVPKVIRAHCMIMMYPC
jgi:hypothetical protein